MQQSPVSKWLGSFGIALLLLISGVSWGQKLDQQPQHFSEKMFGADANVYEARQLFDQEMEGKAIPSGKGYKQFKRWEYFWEPRLYPSGDMVDPGVAYRAKAEERRNNPNPNRMMSGVWNYIGNTDVPTNGGGAGRINMVRVDPNNALIYYACAPAGGLWRSTNAGSTWSVLNTDNLGSIGVSDVAIDPNDSNILYIGTGDGDAADTYAIGVLKSTDGGNTWNPTGLSFSVSNFVRCNRIIIDPSNSDHLIVATNAGLYRTTDAGANWTSVLGGNYKDVQWKHGDSNAVFAVGDGDNFFYSTDNGANWTQSTSGLPTSGISRFALTSSESSPNTLYILAGGNDQGFYGYYRSTDSGLNWTAMSTAAGGAPNILGWDVGGGDTGGQAWYDLATACDPNDPNTVYTGGVNTWKSTDGGATWTIVGHWYGAGGNPYVHADVHGMYFIPGTTTLLVACDGGIFRTLNGGGTFQDISNNMEIAQIYKLSLNPQDQNEVLTGWQDNGTNLKGGSNWDRVVGGDGMECIIDHTNPNNMYATIYYGRIYKTTNGSSFGSVVMNSGGSGSDEDGAWVTPYVMSPSNSQKIAVAKNSMHVTTNGGNSWTSYALPAGGTANAMAMAKTNEDHIYISKGATLYRTTDGGSNWTTLSGLPNLSITYIAIDPADETRLWVTFSGFNGSNKVYYSSDSGATWSNFSDGLPQLPCNTIVYHEGSSDGLYVGTDAGVYYRDTNYATWQPYSDGLPDVVVSELEIHYASSTVVASTYGRGVWNAPLFVAPANDGAILAINSPSGVQCGTDVEGEVVLVNYGSNTLTSATIAYGANGAVTDTYNWTGSLSTGASTTISLPPVSGTVGTQTFVAEVTSANGTSPDDNPANDSMSATYEVQTGDALVNFALQTDCWGNETGWILRQDDGTIIDQVGANILASQTLHEYGFCLTAGCFELEVTDTYGDGLNGTAFGCGIDGDYDLTLEDGTVLAEMTVVDFDNSAVHPFCVSAAVVEGCTDSNACNYDMNATQDDGSCEFTSCAGCTDSNACNYDANATIDNGSCDLPDGCTDSNACNYDAAASCDDGSCEFTTCAGCTDSNACNYDASATIDNGSCEFDSCAGCTDDTACNYDASATIDNMSCEYSSCNPACLYDLSGDGQIGVADLLVILGDFGCTNACIADLNGDGETGTADILSVLSVFGNTCP